MWMGPVMRFIGICFMPSKNIEGLSDITLDLDN